jgi:hypothetical protein
MKRMKPMMRRSTWCVRAAGLGLLCAMALPAVAQEAPAAAAPQAEGSFRRLAPGVMKKVDPARRLDETFSRHDIVELLAVDPSFDWAKDVAFRHETWSLEFQYKVPRMIWIDLPQSGGRMQRKLVWYMVYSVTNTGQVMVPVEDKALGYPTTQDVKLWEVKTSDKPVRFIPQVLFEARSRGEQGETVSVYKDQVVPLAVAAIQNREDPKRKLHTTPEMCREIAVGETVWGVFTWHDVDATTGYKPALYRFTVYIQGLTNAYRWKDDPATLQIVDGVNRGRRLQKKTLKLNFWRPGDEHYPHEGEIRHGYPGEVDYEWVYR